MSKPNVKNLLRSTKSVLTKHSPGILTGIGIAGMITTTVLAVRATPKALRLMEEAEEEKGEKLTPVETVKTAWKPYIPAAVTGTLSVACLVGASSVNARRNAALATAYKMTETALTEYRDKVVETVGPNKEKTIREKVAEAKLEKHPVNEFNIEKTKYGDTLCFEPLSARYFTSSIDHIKRAENALNKRLLHDISGSVSVNEFYDELDLQHTDVGYDLGWNTDSLLEIDFSSKIADNGQPCIVIDYVTRPRYGYEDFLPFGMK